jgi:carbamoyltransferase
LDGSAHSPAELIVGFSGAARNACVAVCGSDRVLGICEQERITRVRGAGVNRTGLPDEALDELLRRAGRSRSEVAAYVTSEDSEPDGMALLSLEHHFAHACAAFLPSPFESASIVVCDHASPHVSVWDGNAGSVTRVDWPWHGLGLAEFYSQCAEALGFRAEGREQRLEALARLAPSKRDVRAEQLIGFDVDRLRLARDWRLQVEGWETRDTLQAKAAVASALQSRVGDLLVELLAEVRRRMPFRNRVCVGGSLFYNSYLNSRVRQAGMFDEVFVPINPGNAGLALGAALHNCSEPRQEASPFLGPSYDSEEIKATLDNCKLVYQWVSWTDTVAIAVKALQKGRLVAWFDGAMEWGPRALGARSIVANPFAPYVLDNLNRFLKKREPWRGYALSGIPSAVCEQLAGPETSPFMECDFLPRDRERFQHVLPMPDAAVRVHTVDSQASPRFHALLEAFGQASGLPILVNTSFNGFQEPIVCSPRDAIRVFFGTGIDLLVLGQFVLAK